MTNFPLRAKARVAHARAVLSAASNFWFAAMRALPGSPIAVKRPRKARLAAIAALGLCLTPLVTAAQGKQAWEEYGKLLESRQNVAALSADDMFGESLDLYSGGLSFSAIDVSIPGNSKLPVAVSRKLTISDRYQYGGPAGGSFGDWEVDIPNLSGVFAPAWHDNRCDTAIPPTSQTVPANEYWAGNHADMPGGGEMLQTGTTWPQPSTGGPYKWVTAGNTYFSCLPNIDNGTGQGFLAVTSDGTKYWFNHMARIREPDYTYNSGGDYKPTVSRYKVYLYVTRVEDRFENWVTYSYSNSSTQPVKLTQITSNDLRTIGLQYNANGLVSSVTAGSRTWEYAYQNGSLTTVTLPHTSQSDISQWQIAFSSLAAAQIELSSGDSRTCYSLDPLLVEQDYTGTITHPSGATATYTVGPVRFGRTSVPAICRNWQAPGTPDPNGTNDDYFSIPVRAWALTLKSRQISGPGLDTGTWTYAWSGGPGSWRFPPSMTTPVCGSTDCLDPVCVSSDCAGSRSVTVTEPNGDWTKHRYGTSYRYNEGKLLSTSTGNGSTTLRTIKYDYNYATSGQPYSAKIGVSPLGRGAGFVSEYVRPMTARVTTQQDTDFIWLVDKNCTGTGIYCFDSFARPTKVVKTSMTAGTTELIAPTGKPTLTVPTTTLVDSYTVTWTSVAYASRYELQERFGGGAWSTIHNAAGTTVALSGKANGSWDYQVRACNSQACAGWSTIATISVTVPPSSAPVVTAPATNNTSNYQVSWTTVPRATLYELDESKDGGAWVNIYSSTGTAKGFTLKSNGSYQYRARACNTGGCSGYSATATTVVNVTAPPPPAPATLTAPATADALTPFTVSWSSVSGATSYELERIRNGIVTTAYNGSGTSTSQNLGMPATYQYRVQACNASGCGAYSPTKTVVVQGE